MAEEKKETEFVLNKKPETHNENAPSSNESSPQNATSSEKSKGQGKKKVIVRKTLGRDGHSKVVRARSPIPQPKESLPKEKPQADSSSQAKSTAEKVAPAPVPQNQTPNRGERRFELQSSRPNIKAGNLAERARGNFGGKPGGVRTGTFANENFSGRQARENVRSGVRTGTFANQNRLGGVRTGTFANQNRQGGFGGNRSGGFGSQNRQGFGGNRPGGFGPRPPFGSAPAPIPAQNRRGTPNKKKNQQQYTKKDREEWFDEETKKKPSSPASVVPKTIDIMETISVSDLAKKDESPRKRHHRKTYGNGNDGYHKSVDRFRYSDDCCRGIRLYSPSCEFVRRNCH